MRQTLRRSCNACARSKLSCDLKTPQCSRCVKRKSACVYANQPLTLLHTQTSPQPTPKHSPSTNALELHTVNSQHAPIDLLGSQTIDPFDSYPSTRLPRAHIQMLIQHFLSHISFQYYPLDLSKTSNPFVVNWWPLALADPALFHVSLQTASLDVDLRAQNGFENSEILMADSVSLIRLKIEDAQMGVQDETLNSVVTLAAIEFGKGNIEVGRLHVDGVKRMVQIRGGINKVKNSSPLTARMVSWVSLIVTQVPQFPTQDDSGVGDGIAPSTQWIKAAARPEHEFSPSLLPAELDPSIRSVLSGLRTIFHEPSSPDLSSSDLHDLTCFLLHRLLESTAQIKQQDPFPGMSISECIRNALILYLLLIHGPTYFPHLQLQYTTLVQLKLNLEISLAQLLPRYTSLALWLLSIGTVAAENFPERNWFFSQVSEAADMLRLSRWNIIMAHIAEILWHDSPQLELSFRQVWNDVGRITAI